MIVLALLLFAVAIALIVVVVVEGGDSVTLDAFNRSIDTTVWGVFVAGVVTGLIVLAGLAALLVGIRQLRSRRREIAYLRERVAQQERGEAPADSDDQDVGAQRTGDWFNQRHGDSGRPASPLS